MTPLELAAELKGMYEYLALEYDEFAGHDLARRLTELSAKLARSGELYAEARRILAVARGKSAQVMHEKKIPATFARELIAALVADEQALFDQVDRLNSTLVHTIEATRSQISFQKAQAFEARHGG